LLGLFGFSVTDVSGSARMSQSVQVQVGLAFRVSSVMSRPVRTPKKNAAFTLPEVMITMFLISMMCLAVFAGLQQITKAALAVAVRSEAYHLMQAEAEQLLAGDFTSFAATAADQTITSSVKTSYLPNTTAALGISTDNAVGRTTFTRRVVAVSSTATSKTLRVEVQWTWQGRPYLVSVQLFRTQ
jgi:prepilin-type N-terminal cleavage/methylation domain-containing protein